MRDQSGTTAPIEGPPVWRQEDLPQEVILAFVPLHKRAFGVASGVTLGIVIFVVTIASVLVPREQVAYVALLSQYFTGYSVSWAGAFLGFAWGSFVGFIAGWFIAFVRNLAMAGSFWIGRTREELRVTRDFLDHI